MSQLIALIIAIALGAIVTAIGYVFLGDAFTSNSERGVALQLTNQGSQMEMAMSGYRATNAKGAADGIDFSAGTATAHYNSLTGELVAKNFLKDKPVSPITDTDGNSVPYTLFENTVDGKQSLYMVVDSGDLGSDLCSEIEELAGRSGTVAVQNTATDAIGALTTNSSRFGCYDSTTGYLAIYKVQ